MWHLGINMVGTDKRAVENRGGSKGVKGRGGAVETDAASIINRT